MVKKLLVTTAAMSMAALATSPAYANATISLFGSDSVGTYGNARTFSGVDGTTTINVQATGWSVDSAGTIHQGALGRYSGGLGVINSPDDDSHTVDNSGWTDFVVFQFDRAVNLSRVNFTSFGDTDATIRYGTVASPWNTKPDLDNDPRSVLTAFTPNAFNSLGGDVSGFRSIGSGSATGNWWVVSALDPADNNGDFFKIKELDVSLAAGVPEPSAWLLMILGFGAVGWSLRRRRSEQPGLAASLA